MGTPGRLLDLVQQGHLDLSRCRAVVLDEADEMLDLGFLPDVERLLSRTPAGRQTMLFSATMPSAVVSLARAYMTQPTHIRAHDPDDDGATVKLVKQFAYRTHPMDRIECLARLLQSEGRGLTIVFTRTRRNASKVADDLVARGFAAAPIHGDLGQGAREQALRAFRNGKVDVLIATDVAARGIDVEDVTHVVNYECPDDAKTYIHRIGRTGRAGAAGTAVTFVEWADTVRWQVIAREIGIPFDEPVETYSTSPHLFTDLLIPEGTTGRLPRAARTRAGLEAEDVEDIEGAPKRPRREDRDGGRSSGGRDGGRESGRDGGRAVPARRPGAQRRSWRSEDRAPRREHADDPGAVAVAERPEGEEGATRPRRRRRAPGTSTTVLLTDAGPGGRRRRDRRPGRRGRPAPSPSPSCGLLPPRPRPRASAPTDAVPAGSQPGQGRGPAPAAAGSAPVEQRLGHLAVGLRGRRAARRAEHAEPAGGRLGHPDRARHRTQHRQAVPRAEVVEHRPGVRAAPVDHGRQQPDDHQPGVELGPDVGDGVEQLADRPVPEHLRRQGTSTSSAATSAPTVSRPRLGAQSSTTSS